MTIIDAEEKMSLARTIVRYRAPYYSTPMSGLVFMPMPGIHTMCLTSNLILGYDPEWALMSKPSVLAADVAHEINHFLRRHLERGIGKNPHLVNLAGDFSINPDLVAAGWDLADASSGRPAILPKAYGLPEGLSMEEYYVLLAKQEKSSTNAALKKLLEQIQDGGGGIGSGTCGAAAHGQALTAAEQELTSIPGAGRSKAEVRSIEIRSDKQIKDYVASNGRGTVPAALLGDVEQRKELSRVRWQDILARVIRTATGQITLGDEDSSYARPSRRSSLSSQVLRPSYFSRLPEVAIVRDTSGSMGTGQLTDSVREAFSVVKALGIDNVWFTDADAEVSMPWQRVRKEFFDTLTTAHGGGGTDFGPAILDAQRLSPKPDLLVYCTDGDGDAGPPPESMAVVFAIVPSPYSKTPCKWATTVLIEDPGKSRS